MKALLLLTLLFFTALSANKVIYLSYENVPSRVVKGEVFSVTLKSIATAKNFTDISYKFSNHKSLRILNSKPYRNKMGKYYLEKFYFIATSTYSKLPNITATLVSPTSYQPTTIGRANLNVISLNPKKDYSNIIANSFELLEYKTTNYDTKHNIIVFTAQAKNSNLSAIKFKNVFKQGIESENKSFFNPKITYFIVVKNDLDKFSFSYFNLQKNKFIKVIIPIIVDDDSVTTQTDLKPKDQSKEVLKMNIAGVIAIIIFLFAIWRRKYIYLVLVLFPLIYVGYIAIPSKEVCIKEGSMIHLLPVNNGTIFETTTTQSILPKEGHVKGFIKVKLENEKIGWVKNEDICSP